MFSALLIARDEHGVRLTDQEVRDELLTLLLAGHETTATGLAWALDLLLHNPDDAGAGTAARRRLPRRGREGDVAGAAGDPGVGRVVKGAPFALGEWLIPPGVEINPSIRMIHRRADLYPDPKAFRPERFIGDDAPDTYTWLPFGGGTRRCLGASFAMMEIRLVLRRVLERASLRAASPQLEPTQFRAITLAPRTGVRVVLDHRPRPASDASKPDQVGGEPAVLR